MWSLVWWAAGLSLLTKALGYFVPEQWLHGRAREQILPLLPVAMMSGLAVTQIFVGSGGSLVLDARAVGLAVAAVLLLLRMPFLVVVIAAAAVSAGLRLWG